jgi:ankyrin repeat protein
MDPVGAVASILQISKNAYQLGKYIHDVYEGTKRIDENVRSLASEVNGLADSCKLVHDELYTVLTRSPSGAAGPLFDNDGRLGRCVDQQVVQCDNTLDELRRMVDVLWPRNGTLYQRVSKQIDLQNSRAQTNEIRKRIRSHTDALHTILLVINIRVSHFASDYTPQQLLGNLDDLKARLVNIESKLGGPQNCRDSTGDGNTTLVDVAEETLRSGKTLYEKSFAGTVRGNDSVMGDEPAVTQAGSVGNWVDTVNKLRRASREGYVADVELPSGLSDDGRDTTATGSTSGGVVHLPKLDEDDSYDSDDEQVELAQAALLKGNRAFDAQNWDLAAKVLHTSLKLLYKLPHKHKRQQDIFGLQYRLAVCSYHTGDVDHAEAGLESLLQHEPVSDKEGVQLCDARHMLSRIYVERDKLELARDACEGTLKARSRLLGKQHGSRYESMALMSRILQLLQDDVLSDLYASRIPDAQRNDLLAAVSTLQPKASLSVHGSVLALPTTSEPRLCTQYTGSNAREVGTSPRTMPIRSRSANHGPSPAFSPRLSPLSLSPNIYARDFPASLDIEDNTSGDHIGPPLLEDGDVLRKRSTISRSSGNDADPQITIDIGASKISTTSDLPVRPHRIYSAPVITVTPTQSVRKPSRAPSVISLDEPQDLCLPLRTSGPGDSGKPLGPMSRSERHRIVKRFKMERKCMHNLDQSICEGTLENSLTLVDTLHSTATHLGSKVSPIVFNQWADGLRLATKSPALHLAVLFGDDALVEPLIKNGFSPTFAYQLTDEPGMRDYLTPFDFAIASRNEPIIRILLSSAAVLAPPSSDSPCRHLLAHTSLQFWPPSGVPEVMSLLELLLSCGWPVSKGFSRQNNPSPAPTLLHQACSLAVHLHDYRLPLVKFLIEQSDTTALSAPATETPLHHAVRRDDAEVVDILLQAQASFRLRGLLDKKNSHDCQPLYLAVQRAIADHYLPLDIIRSLLDRGANLDEPHTMTEARLLRLSKKTRSTARSIAMASGRQDLILLVHSIGERHPPRPLTRARTVSDDVSIHRTALPQIGVLQ